MKAIDETIVNRIRDRLVAAEQTLAVAESVTAGMLQVAFSSAFNVSAFFQGGITAYNPGQKARHLLLDPIHGERCNCVLAYTATTMAENCCTLFSSDWGIGITGYASHHSPGAFACGCYREVNYYALNCFISVNAYV